MLPEPHHDSLHDDDKIVYHHSQHQDERKRNDVVEAISYGFEESEICEIDDKK